ncbi:MAG: CHAT domain-containing protein [Bacteroidia bacterium]
MRRFLIVLLFWPLFSWAQNLDDAFYRAVDSLDYLGQSETALTLLQSRKDSSLHYLLTLSELTFRADSKRKAVGLIETDLDRLPPTKDDERLWRLLEYQSIRKHKKKAPLIVAQLALKSAVSARRAYALAVYYQYIEERPGSSERFYLEALALLDQSETAEPHLAGIILRNLGNGAQYKGNYEQSLQYYEQERQAYAPHFVANHQAIGISHYNSANNYYHLGDYQHALENYLKTEAIWEINPVNDTYLRFLYEATGDMYYELGLETQALRYYDKSTLGAPIINNDQSISLLAQGDSVLRSNTQAALPYYEAALAFRKKAFGEAHPLTGACNNFLARTYARRGEYERALLAFQQSLRILCDSNLGLDWREQAELRPTQGYEKYVIEALLGKGEVLWTLYQSGQDTSYLRGAYESFDLAVKYVDIVRQAHFKQDPRFFWSRLAYPIYEQGIATALEFYRLLGERSYYETAFDYSEKSRAYFLQANAQSTKAGQISGIPPEVQKREQDLIAGLEEYQAKVNREQERCDQSRPKNLALWQKEYLRLQNEYQQYLAEIAEQYPAYYDLKFQLASMPLQSIQTSLPDSSLLIEYFFGEEEVYVFGIGAEDFGYEIISQAELLRQKVAEFRLLLSDQSAYLQNPQTSFKRYRDLAIELNHTLVSKIVRDKPFDELIIVPSGPLSQMPFSPLLRDKVADSLENGYQNLPYLFKDFGISYAASASLLFAEQNIEKQDIQTQWLGFAPDYAALNSTYAPLPFSEEELASGQQLFGGQSFVGGGATESNFYAYAAQARILHLATHAIVDHEQTALSYFVLAVDSGADGRLHTYELYGLRLSAELAILSACNTGSGAYVSGEGLMSLGRAFQYAGCPSLLTSLWTVDDRSTADLMSYLYQYLQSGQSRTQAIRSARLAYLKDADPTSMHPFFWSGFVLIGEGGELGKSSYSAYWWVLGGLLAFALVFALRSYFKKITQSVTS